MRANLPGTSNQELFDWPAEPIGDGARGLEVQAFIQYLVRVDSADVPAICRLPYQVDRAIWQSEHLRQIVMELNTLTTKLDGICTRKTCPKMAVEEGSEYLCAAHKSPQPCCAIDYVVHTLDGTTSLLAQMFPDRDTIAPASVPYFASIARRLYRIFGHVYHHHRDLFEETENEANLCYRFEYFAAEFALLPDNVLESSFSGVCFSQSQEQEQEQEEAATAAPAVVLAGRGSHLIDSTI
jgi:hypothetical protein